MRLHVRCGCSSSCAPLRLLAAGVRLRFAYLASWIFRGCSRGHTCCVSDHLAARTSRGLHLRCGCAGRRGDFTPLPCTPRGPNSRETPPLPAPPAPLAPLGGRTLELRFAYLASWIFRGYSRGHTCCVSDHLAARTSRGLHLRCGCAGRRGDFTPLPCSPRGSNSRETPPRPAPPAPFASFGGRAPTSLRVLGLVDFPRLQPRPHLLRFRSPRRTNFPCAPPPMWLRRQARKFHALSSRRGTSPVTSAGALLGLSVPEPRNDASLPRYGGRRFPQRRGRHGRTPRPRGQAQP